MMEVDSKLKFSCENFQQTLVGDIPDIDPDNLIMHLDISEPYPSLCALVQFASIVYTDMGKDTHEDYEKKLNLPSGWKLLTTACNDGWKNGYFGAALWNSSLQQVVVTHRGTNPTETGAMWTNLTGVVFKNDSYRMTSAITFVEKVKCGINEANKSCKRYHLSITGHSLGGWLAQISGFSVKCLRVENGKFIRSRDQQNGLHAHIVAFDSPGCKSKLDEIMDTCDYRYGRTASSEALDISNYLSAPNSINTFGLHVGSIYRVMIDVSKFSVLQRFSARYTLAAHDIGNLVEAFKKNKKIFGMKDWPVSYAVTSSPEYDNFHLEGTQANEYHLDLEEAEDEFSTDVRYKLKSDKSGSLRIFSDDELKFLHFWIIFKKETVKTVKIQLFLTKHNLGECENLFEDFEIDIKNRTITCDSKESLDKVVKRAKLLVRWFREELMEVMDQQSTEIPGVMYFMANQNYIDCLPKCQMNFRDSIGLRVFLESDAHRILHIETEDGEFEMARLYNVFCQLQKQPIYHENLKDYLQNDNQTFVHWKDMVTLGDVVDCDNLREIDFTRDNLLVIDCSSSTDTSLDLGGEKMFKKFINNIKKKLILVSPLQSDSKSVLKSFNVAVKKETFKSVKLIDLTEDAQNELFVRKMLTVRGDILSLADYAGSQNIADFLPLVNNLIDPRRLKNIVTNQNYVIELKDPLLNHDDLRVHSALNRQVCAMRVTKVLRDRLPGTLLVISGVEQQESDERTEAWGDLMQLVETNRSTDWVTTSENAEPLFKQLCSDEPDKKIYWFDISAGTICCKQMYEKDFYVKRKFYNQITFGLNGKENILMDKGVQDIFIFQNVSDKKSLMDLLSPGGRKEDFLNSENIQTAVSAEQVEDIMKRNNHKPVHVLTFEDNGGPCLWLRSRGSLEGLRPYMTAYTSKPIDEGDMCKIRQKVVIIADEPGVGKSTSLTSMSRLFKSAWVIRINLKDFLIPIQNLPPVLSLLSVTEFLLEEKFTENKLLHGLLQFCLKHEQSRQVYILFDGFDEIKEDSSGEKKNTKNEVLRLLQFLKNETTARIWVTTRLYLRKMLENGLGVFAMTFQKISEEQQREYILKFWRSHLELELDDCGDAEESKLMKVARDLYRDVKEALGTDINRFMGILLQTRMLAELFLQPVKDNVVSEVGSTFKIKSVLDLYQKFVSHKYDIYFSDKTRLNTAMSEVMKNSNVEQITEKHRMLGVFTVFPEFANENFDDIEDDMTLWGAELSRIGLVQSGGNRIENIEFTHNTLAEYFCADFAVHWLHKRGRYHGHAPVIKLLLTKILLQDSHNVMRTFINKLVLSQLLSKDAEKFCTLKIIEIWNNTQYTLFNQFQKTALHIAVEEGNDGVIDILVGGFKSPPVQKGYIAFIAAHDQNGDTALGLAAQADSEKIMKKIVLSIETCPHEVILELLLATYIRFKFVLPHRIERLSNYLEREIICSKLKKAFIRTKKIIQEDVPLFLEAVRDGREKDVDEFYHKMENDTVQHYMLLAPDDEGDTALHLAAQDKHNEYRNKMQIQIIRILCNHYFPGIGRLYNSKGRTPLHCAASAGHLDIVEHLLNHGVHTDSLSLHGDTALAEATEMGHLPIVEYLAEKGADINISNKICFTPLFYAARGGHLTVAKYLVENGANIKQIDMCGCTILFAATPYGTPPLVEYFVEKGVDINTSNKNGKTALFNAAFTGNLPMVEYLVEKGADIKNFDKNDCTILFYAARSGHLPILKYFVEKGMNINSVDADCRTVLFDATTNGSLPLVEYLVEKGMDINTLDKDGRTILFEAATNGNLPLVKYLVEKEMDINTLDKDGCSILFKVATNGNLPLVKYLIKKGTDINTSDKNNRTVLFNAATNGSLPLIEYLVEKGMDINTLDKDGCTILFEAATNGNLPLVKYLIEKGMDINTSDKNNRTVLFNAATSGSLPLMEYLVEKEMDINTLDKDGCTILFEAATNGNLSLVKYLVEKGMDINTLDKDGCTILFKAATNGNLPLVKYLVKKGMDINTSYNNGRTVLFNAVTSGNLALVEYMLGMGADINTSNKSGCTVLFYAATNGSLPLVEYLVKKGVDVNASNKNGCTALFHAATNGNLPFIEYLLEKGADINTFAKDGCTILFPAASNGSLPLVEYLVDNGVDINASNNNRRTALFNAATNGSLRLIKYLVMKGADINTFDEDGCTVLFPAASNGSLPLVEYLVENGVDINTSDKFGHTALFNAATNGGLPLVKYLMEKGADVNTLCKHGHNALFNAAISCSLPVVEYLIENGADFTTLDKIGNSVLFFAAFNGSLPIVKHLLENGADFNSSNNNGLTILFAATNNGSLPLVEYIVENGMKMNTLDNDGCTVLFTAAFNGNLPLVNYLVEKGVDINIINKNGCTSLHAAITNGRLPVVEYFVKNGVDINILDKGGNNVLSYAATNGSLPLVKYLVDNGADINNSNVHGRTVLFTAAAKGNLPLVQYLVEKGADVNTSDNEGMTALSRATEMGCLPVVKFLKAKLSPAPEKQETSFTP